MVKTVVPTPTRTLFQNDVVKLSLATTSPYASSRGLAGIRDGSENTSTLSLRDTDKVTRNGATVQITSRINGSAISMFLSNPRTRLTARLWSWRSRSEATSESSAMESATISSWGSMSVMRRSRIVDRSAHSPG